MFEEPKVNVTGQRNYRGSSNKPFPQQYEVVAGLGHAYKELGDCSKASGYLEKAMTLRPPDTLLLNALGDCYLEAGNLVKAAEVLARSLELDPDQAAIKDRLASIQSEN